MALTTTYTGRTRYRVLTRLFRRPLLVLQVEFRVHGYEVHDSFGSGADVDYIDWRDATVGDISVMETVHEQ